MAGLSLRVDWPAVAPLRSLASWFSQAWEPTPALLPCPDSPRLAVRPRVAVDTGSRATRLVRSRPLRVLRVVDGSQGRASAGRMVISGRLADVCAELDRLAALEAG